MNVSLRPGWPLLLVIMLLAVFLPALSRGATVNVSVVNNAFVPASTNINVNDTVTWVWAGNNHNVVSTSAPQAWTASPIKSTPFSFSVQFTSSGAYPYKCSVHNFTGTINVTAPHQPPTVNITSPVANSVFAAPATVTVSASVADSGATVTNVEFLVGATIVGHVTGSPFTLSAPNIAAGATTLTAIATDTLGARGTNSVDINVVTPVATAISAPAVSSTHFTFSFSATVGLNYIVQASADLLTPGWTNVFTNAPATSSVVTVQLPLSSGLNYYRVGRLPNP